LCGATAVLCCDLLNRLIDKDGVHASLLLDPLSTQRTVCLENDALVAAPLYQVPRLMKRIKPSLN
jgi:hypothetical protein